VEDQSAIAIQAYVRQVERAVKAGNSTEHTHRPSLKQLVESLRRNITATNEPQRIECGSPDLIVTLKDTPVGYIEAKDVGIDLDAAESSEQLKRYRSSLSNLVLTDYLEFRLYRNGDLVQSVRLANILKNGALRWEQDSETRLKTLLDAFFDADTPSISSARELAERMARVARLLHDLIREAFGKERQGGDLHSQYTAFQRVLIADLTVDQFADMYAQTIAYGLFAARCNHVGPGFKRESAGSELPKTNPFLRRLFNTIAGADLDERISWAVDDLALLLSKADIAAILEDFGRATLREDPVVHFYETFLAAYDPRLRELRGVYYTPEPVVDYIVRSVDLLLQREFKLSDGLANSSRVKVKRNKIGIKRPEIYETHRVQILDPACGTGTFLHSVIANIFRRFTSDVGLWPSYVAGHLLPRIYGFELLMAPYAVAHMKLGIQLRESGYDFRVDERLRVFLTNTLEEAHEMTGLPLFTQWLAEEAAAAGEVKKNVPIMVVIGNPPYSGHSANKGAWIQDLLEDYKKSPELKKPAQAKWLSDDYVKFLRFAQWRIEQTGSGILAFVTNHMFASNPTFVDMRASLMATFDELYFLDLHGSTKPKETPPPGVKDKNVFDIQKGVAVSLFIKRATPKGRCTVHRADLWGSREEKYSWLASNDVTTTNWEDVTPTQAPWLFIKQDSKLITEYGKAWSVADIFRPNGDPAPGIVTTHDEFAISWSRDEAITKVDQLLATSNEDEARELFTLCSQDQWNYSEAKRELADGAWRDQATSILYRPFDVRWTIWNSNVAVHRRERAMRHMLGGKNIALISNRQVNGEFAHALVTRDIINDCTLSTQTKERSFLFPLYLSPAEDAGGSLFGEETPIVNLAPDFLSALGAALAGKQPSPDTIFAYIYAILNSPGYRARYADLLKRDFARIPITSDVGVFRRLATLGQELIDIHLLERTLPSVARFPRPGSNRVDKVESRRQSETQDRVDVFINADQYFEGVPTAIWTLVIGSYPVASKWLKDRKGRLLSFDDLQHYGQLLSALNETLRIQKQIDLAIGKWPIS